MAFDSKVISTYVVLIAQPQPCFHNNRLTREKLTALAWNRLIKGKLKRFAGEIKDAKQP